MGGQEKRKDRKTRKSRSEEKVVGFSLAYLFLARKREAITQGGTRGIDHRGEPRELVSLKVGRTSETVATFQIHSQNWLR